MENIRKELMRSVRKVEERNSNMALIGLEDSPTYRDLSNFYH